MTFSSLQDTWAGSLHAARSFWSPGNKNMLLLGDSLVSYKGIDTSLTMGLMRAWDHPAGWGGFHTCSDSQSKIMFATATNAADRQEAGLEWGNVTDFDLYNDSWYHGLPCGYVSGWKWGDASGTRFTKVL